MIEWLDFFLNKSVENQKMCIFNKSIEKYNGPCADPCKNF